MDGRGRTSCPCLGGVLLSRLPRTRPVRGGVRGSAGCEAGAAGEHRAAPRAGPLALSGDPGAAPEVSSTRSRTSTAAALPARAAQASQPRRCGPGFVAGRVGGSCPRQHHGIEQPPWRQGTQRRIGVAGRRCVVVTLVAARILFARRLGSGGVRVQVARCRADGVRAPDTRCGPREPRWADPRPTAVGWARPASEQGGSPARRAPGRAGPQWFRTVRLVRRGRPGAGASGRCVGCGQ